MPFTLTPEHLASLMDPIKEGNMGPFLAAVDEEVEWRVGASDKPGTGHNLAAWKKYIPARMMGVFGGPDKLQHKDQVVDIIGNKVIIEEIAHGQMRNGEAFMNRQCLIFEFLAETGKIVKVRAYLDTEVMAAAKRANGVPVEDD